jgi:hypothetical protein
MVGRGLFIPSCYLGTFGSSWIKKDDQLDLKEMMIEATRYKGMQYMIHVFRGNIGNN